MTAHRIPPPCPRCKRKNAERLEGGFLRCRACGAFFDDDPDEGGDYCADPTKRIERLEGRDRNGGRI
jgi:ribosomal protein L37AE/L43A